MIRSTQLLSLIHISNLKARENLYETLGPISCFVGVGGNITTIGLEEDKMKAGVMVPYTVTSCLLYTSSFSQSNNAVGKKKHFLIFICGVLCRFGV